LYVFVVIHSYSEFTANLQHFRNTAKCDITVRRQFAFPSNDYERVDGYFPSKYISPSMPAILPKNNIIGFAEYYD